MRYTVTAPEGITPKEKYNMALLEVAHYLGSSTFKKIRSSYLHEVRSGTKPDYMTFALSLAGIEGYAAKAFTAYCFKCYKERDKYKRAYVTVGNKRIYMYGHERDMHWVVRNIFGLDYELTYAGITHPTPDEMYTTLGEGQFVLFSSEGVKELNKGVKELNK